MHSDAMKWLNRSAASVAQHDKAAVGDAQQRLVFWPLDGAGASSVRREGEGHLTFADVRAKFGCRFADAL